MVRCKEVDLLTLDQPLMSKGETNPIRELNLTPGYPPVVPPPPFPQEHNFFSHVSVLNTSIAYKCV